MTDHKNDNDFDAEDPLSNAWKKQPEPDDVLKQGIDPSLVVKLAASAHRQDQVRLVTVNVQEFVPTLLLAALFGSNVPHSTRPALVLAATVLALGIGFFLLGSSIHYHRADRRWGSSMREQLERRRAQLNHFAWMYRNLAYWHTLPLALAFGLFIYGVGGIPLGEGFLIWSGMMVVVGAVYWVVRKIGRARYEDEAERFTLLLEDFDLIV